MLQSHHTLFILEWCVKNLVARSKCIVFYYKFNFHVQFYFNIFYLLIQCFKFLILLDCITMVPRTTPYQPNRGIPMTVKAEA